MPPSPLRRSLPVRDHVKILAILNIVLGGLGVIGALVVLLVFGGIAGLSTLGRNPDAAMAAPFMGLIGGTIAIFILVVSAPAVIAGFGLLKLRPWARILTIILSVLHLFNVPIGTALGVYGLWVLLNRETEVLFASR